MRLKTSLKPLCLDIALSSRAKSTLLLGASCALLSGGSFALGLGDIHTATYLGQYLEAQVSLVDGERSYQASELSVRQVLAREAQSLGIELVDSRYLFLLELTGEGESLGLRVRSRRPITEPYINFLVSLEWASGSVYREYTLFLDPPPEVSEALGSLTAMSREPVNTNKGRLSTSPSVGSAVISPKVDLKAVSPSGAVSQRSRLDAPTTIEAELTHYRIRSGDTLSKIAERWRQGTEETIRSTSHWLFENNPDAFSGGNEHQLIAGSLLQLPSRSQLPLSAQSLDPVSASRHQEPAAKITADLASEAAQGRLRLAKDNNAPLMDIKKASRTRLSADLDTNRELIDQLRRENNDLRGRLNKLEGSDYVQMLTRLIELQNLQIDRLREGATRAPNDSARLLLTSAPPSARPSLDSALASAQTPESTETLMALPSAPEKVEPGTGLLISGATAAALADASGESQSSAARTLWQTTVLLGLPLLAVGLYFLAWFRLRSRPAADTVLDRAVDPMVDVGQWQPVVDELEGVRLQDAVITSGLGDDTGPVDIRVPEATDSPEDLDKPLLLLDEVLDREFEALVEAADFDPTCEFPDLDADIFDLAVDDTNSTSSKAEPTSGISGSPESDALQAAIVAAAGDETSGGVAPSPFNDSFEGLEALGELGTPLHELGDLQGIDQDFGLSDAVQSAAHSDPLQSTAPEPDFELSHDQRAEFEEDWLDESSLSKTVDSALVDEPAENSSAEDESSSLRRRRDDDGQGDDALTGIAKVLPFQRRRSDAEVRKSIQAKTNDYTPPDEAYVVCDCDDDTVLSLDFNLIDDPEFSEQGLNVDGFAADSVTNGETTESDTPVTSEEVAGIVAGTESTASLEANTDDRAVTQPLFVDLQFRDAGRDDSASQVSPH